MLRGFFFLSSFFFTAALFAQSSFVEVSVEDTLQYEPDAIIYLVSYSPPFAVDSTTTPNPSTLALMRNNETLKEVRKIILAMRLDTLPNETNYTLLSNPYVEATTAIRNRFSSAAQLQTFINSIRKLEGINGAISELKSSKQNAYDRLLFKRMLEKASEKARMIAQLTGKKMGTLLSIKEQIVSGGWTMYPPLSAIPGWHTSLSLQQSDKIILSKAAIFQFNWQ